MGTDRSLRRKPPPTRPDSAAYIYYHELVPAGGQKLRKSPEIRFAEIRSLRVHLLPQIWFQLVGRFLEIMPEPDGGSARGRPNENGPRRRSNEDGARRRRRRNRNRPRGRPKSRISELAENVLDVPKGNAESYVTNMREIAGYIVRTVPNGGEFVTALDPDDLGFTELTVPTDPEPNATSITIKSGNLN